MISEVSKDIRDVIGKDGLFYEPNDLYMSRGRYIGSGSFEPLIGVGIEDWFPINLKIEHSPPSQPFFCITQARIYSPT